MCRQEGLDEVPPNSSPSLLMAGTGIHKSLGPSPRSLKPLAQRGNHLALFEAFQDVPGLELHFNVPTEVALAEPRCCALCRISACGWKALVVPEAVGSEVATLNSESPILFN